MKSISVWEIVESSAENIEYKEAIKLIFQDDDHYGWKDASEIWVWLADVKSGKQTINNIMVDVINDLRDEAIKYYY